ncbi:MAG: UDP-N-acetylmuramoyl-L-alanyl-D-glutamate--2,6-diaminopimelate ligase [Erysipelotrichaceae bacterium]
MERSLKNLLKCINIITELDVEILGISDYHLDVGPNCLFIANDGLTNKVDKFIDEVILNNGYVITSTNYSHPNVINDAQLIEHIPTLIYNYYGDLNSKLITIGVTGTNGKSSVTNFIYQLLNMNNLKCMLIGTSGVYCNNERNECLNTTPSLVSLARCFYNAMLLGCKSIVMEVSSQAIDELRIKLIKFNVIAYTNISSDHIDYHLTFTHYQYSKFKLRKYLKKDGVILVNNNDYNLYELYKLNNYIAVTYGMNAHFNISDIKVSDHDIKFKIKGEDMVVNIIGEYNVENLGCAISVLNLLNIRMDKLKEDVKQIKGVAGRLQVIEQKEFKIWIDYAHTTSALCALMKFASKVKANRIILVFGCGGNRDITKRPQMGQIACRYADQVIVCEDNPRQENSEQIFEMIKEKAQNNLIIIRNRKEAIKHAINIAQKSDIIIVAGRGAETYQIFSDYKIAQSDLDIVESIIAQED